MRYGSSIGGEVVRSYLLFRLVKVFAGSKIFAKFWMKEKELELIIYSSLYIYGLSMWVGVVSQPVGVTVGD